MVGDVKVLRCSCDYGCVGFPTPDFFFWSSSPLDLKQLWVSSSSSSSGNNQVVQ
jgi:hypothetical protein